MEKYDSIELDIINNTDRNTLNSNKLNKFEEPLIINKKEQTVEKVEKKEKEEKKEKNKNNELFGNDIKIINPKKIGNVYAFLYFKDYPLIIIGPDCKKINLLK